MGDPITVEASAKVDTREEFDEVWKREDTLRGGRIEPGPVSNMLFRPEEVHRASGIGRIFKPFPERHCHVRHQTFRLGSKDLPISNLYSNREPAVETGSIDLNCFSGEEPADCQRFKTSLTEPFLLSFNGDSILSGKVVEWSERDDVIGVWI